MLNQSKKNNQNQKTNSHYSIQRPTFFRLYDELDVVLEVAVVVVVHNAEAVGEDPHLHGPVCAAGEDVVGRPHLDLHDARAEVPEDRLARVLVREGVEDALRGQAPDLRSPGTGRNSL